jgi:hypothetical protein
VRSPSFSSRHWRLYLSMNPSSASRSSAMVGEVADPEQLLLERPDESLCDPVPLRLPDEGGRGLDAQEAELVLVVPADELAAVVVGELEADRDLGIIGAEDPAQRERRRQQDELPPPDPALPFRPLLLFADRP